MKETKSNLTDILKDFTDGIDLETAVGFLLNINPSKDEKYSKLSTAHNNYVKSIEIMGNPSKGLDPDIDSILKDIISTLIGNNKI